MIRRESLSGSAPILEETGRVKGRWPLLLIDTGGGSGYKGEKDTRDGHRIPRSLPHRYQLLFLPGLPCPAAPVQHPGVPTNATLGVTTMLLKVLQERQPQHLALVFDARGPTFRHELYKEYKAHRPPMPGDLVTQLPYIKKIIDALNLPSLVHEGYEADDLICTLVRRAREEGLAVEIISGDKDLLPLVQDGVEMWDPMKEVRYDPAAIREKYGLSPRSWWRCGPWRATPATISRGCRASGRKLPSS